MDGLIRLAEAIDERAGTRAEFASAVGCSESHLSLILGGKRGPSLALAARIEALTGISASSLVRDVEPAERCA